MILHPFNSISVISGQEEDENERLCTMDPYLQWKRFPTPGLLDQQASTYPTELQAVQVTQCETEWFEVFHQNE